MVNIFSSFIVCLVSPLCPSGSLYANLKKEKNQTMEMGELREPINVWQFSAWNALEL